MSPLLGPALASLIRIARGSAPAVNQMATKNGRFEMRMETSFLDQVDELAKTMNISKAEVLRQSIGLYAQVLAQAEQGKIIQFEDENLAKNIHVIPSGHVSSTVSTETRNPAYA
jgi:hypothetical protein